ncbi:MULTISPECIES: non-hydrolyzing UDP-N-acetylglucosamine 2-epimerase [unclassified Achromobacter]|uniref:non-hydrolyzing UDP-N-acetylglucosamine 2-epimerase n=1 Tax=unclassified Achromobacter TaxID=2626865 RepID=UPI000B515067|nr:MULTISPECIES: UDP-N-acetylglucosamine 2-epimerase (non-hydrolyzing) [unclassified Achromobacter]OWT73461.1 UDP-N-acetylglucosamine 2-epimerase (non-hydrolyzing) [Achromobacter sp. HZ34]OWT79620.1 UDP-N-acetylglucosamine 2-epimerase (non-hydrolyzing) [Achromobacter sp. HZ28]
MASTQHGRHHPPLKVLSIFGTRPEAIKMAPLLKAMDAEPAIDSRICVTGQHQSMLQQMLSVFDIQADHSLEVMTPGQTLNGLTAALYAALDPVLQETTPDCVLVHGDTTTALVGAMASFHRRIQVGHVEAGLRTADIATPWPEEMNRRCIDQGARWLFAPTAQARDNLLAERLQGHIYVTGNTGIDALHMTARRLCADTALCRGIDERFGMIDPGRKLLLVTGHRRENLGDGIMELCQALRTLSQRDDLQIVYAVHLNPAVALPVRAALGGLPNVHLIEPLDYLAFIRLMQRAHIVLTDSGGVQEEAPALGKPVLVMRDLTERPEAVAAGTVRLVGAAADTIVRGVSELLDVDAQWRRSARAVSPYGDGRACSRIVDALLDRPVDEFTADDDIASAANAANAANAAAVSSGARISLS